MKTEVYNQNGEKTGTAELPEEIFGLPWNPDLVYQVYESMRANARRPFAHAKDRSEVRGGGKKPWAQKGTGRARHGSIRSPIWAGGGVTHGPRKEKNYTRQINKKARKKALAVVLSKKLKDAEIIFVDGLNLKEARTREARNILTVLASVPKFETMKRKEPSVFILYPKNDPKIVQSFRNIPKVKVGEARNANIQNILSYRYLLMTPESVKVIQSTFFKQ